MYLAGFLQLLLPGVAAQLRRVLHMVWKEARWGEYDRPFEPVDYDVVDHYDAIHPSGGRRG